MLFFHRSAMAASFGFDYPAGKPDGTGYSRGEKDGGWDGWGYLEWNGSIWHPGEDWNRGSGETDFGDPLYAVGDGTVVSAKDYGSGWGKIILIEHSYENQKVWSQYAHLSEIAVTPGKSVNRGEFIGKIGNANSRWVSHLHFEVRSASMPANYWPSGLSKETTSQKYNCPTEFIDSHRPSLGQEIFSAEGKNGKIRITWSRSDDPDFDKYVLRRAPLNGEYSNIFETTNREITSFEDAQVSVGQSYSYQLLTYYKNGQVGESQEKSVELKIEIINITKNILNQQYPATDGKIVVWQDWRKNDNNTSPKKLFYYDIGKNEVLSANIAIEGVSIAQEPKVNGKYVCYTAQDNTFSFTGTNIYCYNFDSNLPFKVSGAPKDQINPEITENGMVFWEDKRSGNSDIYYLDLNKSSGESLFVGGTGNQYMPKISEDKVIWKDTRVGNRTDLYLKKIGENTETLLKTNIGSTGVIDIWDDWVIWSKDNKLNLINIMTKEEKIICDTGLFGVARIDSGRIAYVKADNGYYWINTYKIESGKTSKIDFPCYYLPRIDLSGNVLVFDWGEKSTTQVYMDIYLTYL